MLWYCFLYVFILPFFDQKAIKCSIYFHKKLSAPNASLLFLIFPCNKMPALFFLLPAMPSVTPFEVFLKFPASFSSYHGLKFILYRWSLPAPPQHHKKVNRGGASFTSATWIFGSPALSFPLLFSHRFGQQRTLRGGMKRNNFTIFTLFFINHMCIPAPASYHQNTDSWRGGPRHSWIGFREKDRGETIWD